MGQTVAGNTTTSELCTDVLVTYHAHPGSLQLDISIVGANLAINTGIGISATIEHC